MADAIVYSIFAIGLIGFLMMAVAFTRLFVQAMRSSERRSAVRRVFSVQPRKDSVWPNMTREADWIAIGALCGVIFCGGLLAIAFL